MSAGISAIDRRMRARGAGCGDIVDRCQQGLVGMVRVQQRERLVGDQLVDGRLGLAVPGPAG